MTKMSTAVRDILENFEDIIGNMNYLLDNTAHSRIEEYLHRHLTPDESAKVLSRVNEYSEFYNDIFPCVVKDMKQNEYEPESKDDLRELMYEYLDRYPYYIELESVLYNTGSWFDDTKKN